MAKPSNEKQPSKHHKQSRLRHVEQVPDSDTVIPDTQVEAAHRDHGVGLDDEPVVDQADLAFLEHNAFKRPADTTAPSQPFGFKPLNPPFGIEKPSSATTNGPTFSFCQIRRAANKTPPKEETQVLQLFVLPDTAVLSIEQADNEASGPVVGDALTEPPPNTSPTVEQRVSDDMSKWDAAKTGHDQPQPSSCLTATAVQNPNTEHLIAVPSKPNTVTQPTSRPTLQSAPITKKTRNRTKAKKGRKLDQSRSLVPWPPRHSYTTSDSRQSEQHTSHRYKPETASSLHEDYHLAVKPQQDGLNAQMDRPSAVEEQSSTNEAVLLNATLLDNHPFAEHNRRKTLQAGSPEVSQLRNTPDSVEQQPIWTLGCPNVLTEQSSIASHDQLSQTRHIPDLNVDVHGGSLGMRKPTTPPPEMHSQSRAIAKPASKQDPIDASQATPSGTLTDGQRYARDSSSRSRGAHHVLHSPSSEAGHTRVTKVHRKRRATQNIDLRTPATQSNTKMCAVDLAFDKLRTVCRIEQDRAQEIHAVTVRDLKEENARLQTLTFDQLNTIADIKAQLKTTEGKLTLLTEKAKTHQRYVAGLQKDHEKLQKSATFFQKQNEQALQEQIAEVVQEKDTLQRTFETAVDAFTKARSSMLETMQESYARYLITLSDKRELEGQSKEQLRLYEEEKSRRIEFEKQLLPSLQHMQRQLSESSNTLMDRVAGFQTSLESCKTKDRDDCTIENCWKVLQKLEGIPLLTANDVRKAEVMLRSIQERADAGFELLARTSEKKPLPIDDIRQCIREQIQDLQADSLRYAQTVEDAHLAHETSDSLRAELNNQKQSHQQVLERIDSLRQSEVALKSRIAQLEKENDELQTIIQQHEARLRESELEVTQLRERLSKAEDELSHAHEGANLSERLRLEQEQEFRKCRLAAETDLNGLKEQMQQMTDRFQMKERERNALQKDLADSNSKIEVTQKNYDQLTAEVSQQKTTIDTLREQNDRVQNMLRSTEEINLELKEDNRELLTAVEGVRTSLREANGREARLLEKHGRLHQQLGELQNAKDASDGHLRQAQLDTATKIQQVKADHAVEVENLKARLSLAENTQKESQAKMRQMEAAHSQQLEYHKQKANIKFRDLGLQFEQQIQEVRTGSAAKIQVANSQSSNGQGAAPAASQHSHTGKTRKKVDRNINLVQEIIPSTTWGLQADGRTSTTDQSHLPYSHREGSELPVDFFGEEYQNRFGIQAQSHEHEASLAPVDPCAEVVPETQELDFAQGSAAQFEVIESQMPIGNGFNPDEDLSDLSTMPSEDLSEMLLDGQPNPKGERKLSRHLSSPKDAVQISEQPGNGPASDASSTTPQSRPKSRANTASRMTPLPASDEYPQRMQAHDGAQDAVHERFSQSYRTGNNDSSDFMNTNNTVLKQTYTQHTTVHDSTQISESEACQKRKTFGGHPEHDGPFKKLRTSAQSFAHQPKSRSKSYSSYVPAPTDARSHTDLHPSPSSASGRRSSNRQSSITDAQASALRLSSTRNTRSKTNRYADRFGQELDRR